MISYAADSKRLLQIITNCGIIIVHVLIGTVGIIVFCGFVIFSVYSLFYRWNTYFTSANASWLLTEIPGFPVQASGGMIVGVVLGRYLRAPLMIYAWILPLCLFSLMAVTSHFHGMSIFSHFIGGGCSPKFQCFDQFVATLPLVSSLAYSIGGGFGIWLNRNQH